jgi:hypothetical protein
MSDTDKPIVAPLGPQNGSNAVLGPLQAAIDRHAEDLANQARTERSGLDLQVDRQGVEAEVSTKLGDNWTLGAWAQWAYNGSWGAAAKLKAWWGK